MIDTQKHTFKHSRVLYLFILALFSLSFFQCAKKGTPTGGARDTIPPVIVRSSPENYTTNFTGTEIEIRFNEYIKLKDLDKNLIISPPMENRPVITPFNTSKTLKIKITDTLKPDTTYSFNFGKSIVDNNEGNEFNYFKYVFSTGSYIDSLSLKGNVRDAKLVAPEIPTTVMLYDANETYTDSLIYKKKPIYITTTQDSTGYFELTNLKAGKYFLFALKEKNIDYIFQPQDEKIAFLAQPVSVPTDSLYNLILFKERPDYKLMRPQLVAGNHIQFGYRGHADSLDIQLLYNVPEGFVDRKYRMEKRDTIQYWYKPNIEQDSLVFKVTHKGVADTATVRLKKLYRDSLSITAVKTGTFKLKDTFKLRVSTPIESLDPSKFEIMTKDSIKVEPLVKKDSLYNLINVFFPKNEESRYTLKLFPGAVTDFFERTNDTLKFSLNTKISSDYGSINMTLNNIKQLPIIVQLVDLKFNVVEERYISEYAAETTIDKIHFDEVSPAKYYIRIIYDKNQNGRWDSGNYLKGFQPEKIIYYPKVLDIRSNWSLQETFNLKE